MDADRVDRLAFANTLASNRDSQALFGLMETWTSWWRDVLLVQSGSHEACSNIDQQERIARHAQSIERPAVYTYLLTLRRIEGYLRHTVNTRLALDVLMLNLPSPARGTQSNAARSLKQASHAPAACCLST